MPHHSGEASSSRRPPRERRPANDEEDAEYRLALEASKYQEEEDRRLRETRQGVPEDDDDLAKAIKLSKEEDERRRRQLEESNAASLFDDTPGPTPLPQPTGFNNGYQQGNQVDWFANQVEPNQLQSQQTGYIPNAYTGFQQPQQPQQQQQQQQPTGFTSNYAAFNNQPTGLDSYGQQNLQSFQPAFQAQPTGYNPYIQQQQAAQPQLPSPMGDASSPLQPGSHNPWATNQQQALKPTPTGSNNPFATFNHNRPSSARPTMNSLGSLPEQKTLSSFNQPQPQLQTQNSFGMGLPASNLQNKDLNEHETKLNSLLATGDGMDTFGNTGNLRIPAQHTAPGTFVNSAGSGVARLNAEATGNNPFLRQQFTGMPSVSYTQPSHVTGPVGMNGQPNNNPFAGQQQQQPQNHDLIQF